MSRRARVCGVMQVRDEWPLVAVSVTHALSRHVDEVYVLDHASVDGTQKGLRALARRWPGRLHILEYHRDEFWQEACLSTLLGVCAASSPDWIYAFDADEFLLTRDPASGLGDVLADVDQDCVAVRYDVQNWVAPVDFDDAALDGYARLRSRSAPNVFYDMPKRLLVDEMCQGTMNYFDVPFQSKVVFRAGRVPWVVPGTHDLKDFSDAARPEVKSDAVRVAHLPLLSRARLERRAEWGRRAEEIESSPDVSWQSRLVWEFARRGRLDEFWRRHSVREDGDEVSAAALPVVVRDDSLAEALEESVRMLRGDWGELAAASAAALSDGVLDGPSHDVVPFEPTVRVVRDLQLIGDDLARRNARLQAELDGSRTAFEHLRRESDDLLKALSHQSREVEECRQALATVARSRSWRLLAPLRAAANASRDVVRRTRA